MSQTLSWRVLFVAIAIGTLFAMAWGCSSEDTSPTPQTNGDQENAIEQNDSDLWESSEPATETNEKAENDSGTEPVEQEPEFSEFVELEDLEPIDFPEEDIFENDELLPEEPEDQLEPEFEIGTETERNEETEEPEEPTEGVVYIVLFTHIEDNTPGGELGTTINRDNYMRLRAKLIQMAELALSYDLQWVLQPDWKILEAARLYETDEVIATTDGKNVFRYLRENLSVVLDPHSHENYGYNYTDVAYLLELLGVGGSTVIGGHIWDPYSPKFQHWDRFRQPVPGLHYPEALWRGDILIGAGTPNHVNDPIVSGVWRPKDKFNFFVDDPTGNIVAVGAWHNQLSGIEELVDLYRNGIVPPNVMLTASWHILPNMFTHPGGLQEVETSVFQPIAELRDQGLIVVTDFTTLVNIWRTRYHGRAFIYQP